MFENACFYSMIANHFIFHLTFSENCTAEPPFEDVVAFALPSGVTYYSHDFVTQHISLSTVSLWNIQRPRGHRIERLLDFLCDAQVSILRSLSYYS